MVAAQLRPDPRTTAFFRFGLWLAAGAQALTAGRLRHYPPFAC